MVPCFDKGLCIFSSFEAAKLMKSEPPCLIPQLGLTDIDKGPLIFESR